MSSTWSTAEGTTELLAARARAGHDRRSTGSRCSSPRARSASSCGPACRSTIRSDRQIGQPRSRPCAALPGRHPSIAEPRCPPMSDRTPRTSSDLHAIFGIEGGADGRRPASRAPLLQSDDRADGPRPANRTPLHQSDSGGSSGRDRAPRAPGRRRGGRARRSRAGGAGHRRRERLGRWGPGRGSRPGGRRRFAGWGRRAPGGHHHALAPRLLPALPHGCDRRHGPGRARAGGRRARDLAQLGHDTGAGAGRRGRAHPRRPRARAGGALRPRPPRPRRLPGRHGRRQPRDDGGRQALPGGARVASWTSARCWWRWPTPPTCWRSTTSRS